MLERGILLPPSQNEVMFVSTAHGEREVAETLDAIAASLDVVYPLLPGTSHDSKAKS